MPRAGVSNERTLFAVLSLALAGLLVIGCGTAQPPPTPPAPKPHVIEHYENALGMKFARIPAGTFRMGSTDLDPRGTYETPHEVSLTRDFYLGEYEVTLGQFKKFVAATHYVTEAERAGIGVGFNPQTKSFDVQPNYCWKNVGFPQGDDHPVTNVSWQDAAAFCVWLSKLDGQSYRLPTEAEWEYACRAGTTTIFQTGDDPEQLVLVANVADASFHKLRPPAVGADGKPFRTNDISADDGYTFTAPVGKFRPNAFGLYDMHGNVGEWTADWWAPYPNAQGAKVVDPTGHPTGRIDPTLSPQRVTRGGNFETSWESCRSSDRFFLDPACWLSILGFRVALTVDATAPKKKTP